MKSISCTIYYGKEVPNIPVLKSKLKRILTEAELDHAKKIANQFLTKTLISKAFFDATRTSTLVEITREFELIHPDCTLKKEVLEYATLIIFGNLFINDLCPDILDVTLSRKGTKNLASDPALQEFTKGTPTDIYEITLSTRALY